MAGLPRFVSDYALPGQEAVLETFENEFRYATYPSHVSRGELLLASATDSGNTPNTSLLRKGLLMSKNRNTGTWSPWTPYSPNAATNNYNQSIDGILDTTIDLTGGGNRFVPICTRCHAKVDGLIIAGSSSVGIRSSAYRYLASRQLAPNILLDSLDFALHNNLVYVDDDTEGAFDLLKYPNGTTFVFTGANTVSLTLPAPLPGLEYTFLEWGAGDIVLTAATADTLIAPGDAAADSITLTDVGDGCKLLGITTAATPTHQWLVATHNPAAASTSLTIAT